MKKLLKIAPALAVLGLSSFAFADGYGSAKDAAKDVKEGTEYEEEVTKNPITGSKTVERETEEQMKVGNQQYEAKKKTKKKYDKQGNLISDEAEKKVEAE